MLQEIRDAVAAGRYYPQPHFRVRLSERRYNIEDAKKIIVTATACEPYPDGTPSCGGTCWRVFGRDLDGEEAKLGVEVFKDHLGYHVNLITIMDD